MSQIPFILNLDGPSPYYNHDMFPNGMYRRLHARHHDPLDMHTLGLIARLGAHAHHRQRNGELTPLASSNKDLFEVHLDVGLFQPDEISVKVVNDCVIVEGKHEEREDDHGSISRHFVRRYNLPKGYDPEKIVSTLSADGCLTVRAPKPPQDLDKSNEFIVQIQNTGPSSLFLHNKNATSTDANKEKSEESK